MRVLPIPTIKELCKLNQGEAQCKFLAAKDKTFVCLKHSELESTVLRLSQQSADNKDTAEHPKGDNCDGYGKTLISEKS